VGIKNLLNYISFAEKFCSGTCLTTVIDRIQAAMESFQLVGAARSKTVSLPIIATSFGRLVGSGDLDSEFDKFVSVLFETNPLELHCDVRIEMNSRPFEIFYDAVSFFPLYIDIDVY